MDSVDENKYQHKVFTIPNLMSAARLVMIPVFVWLYVVEHNYPWTAAVLVLSGITDLFDGRIARHFNMVSDLGKALDPVADKLTQLAMLICLVTRFPMVLMPLIAMVVKELADGVMSLVILKKSREVHSADWHGKAATALLDVTLILHVIWYEIPAGVSNVLLVMCTVMILFSFVMYLIRNTRLIQAAGKEA